MPLIKGWMMMPWVEWFFYLLWNSPDHIRRPQPGHRPRPERFVFNTSRRIVKKNRTPRSLMRTRGRGWEVQGQLVQSRHQATFTFALEGNKEKPTWLKCDRNRHGKMKMSNCMSVYFDKGHHSIFAAITSRCNKRCLQKRVGSHEYLRYSQAMFAYLFCIECISMMHNNIFCFRFIVVPR